MGTNYEVVMDVNGGFNIVDKSTKTVICVCQDVSGAVIVWNALELLILWKKMRSII